MPTKKRGVPTADQAHGINSGYMNARRKNMGRRRAETVGSALDLLDSIEELEQGGVMRAPIATTEVRLAAEVASAQDGQTAEIPSQRDTSTENVA